MMDLYSTKKKNIDLCRIATFSLCNYDSNALFPAVFAAKEIDGILSTYLSRTYFPAR